MRTTLRAVLLISFTVSFIACSKKESAPGGTDSGNAGAPGAASGAAPAGGTSNASVTGHGKYKMKSGIITSTITEHIVADQTSVSVKYFDDYGGKEAEERTGEVNMMGTTTKLHNMTIVKDGFVWHLNFENKTGTKRKGFANLGGQSAPDYSTFTGAQLAEWHVVKQPSETIAGKTCDVISVDNQKLRTKGSYAFWQGFGMKADVLVGGGTIRWVVTKLDENAAVDPAKFEVPAGFTIKELP
jgi:hypothetical protein